MGAGESGDQESKSGRIWDLMTCLQILPFLQRQEEDGERAGRAPRACPAAVFFILRSLREQQAICLAASGPAGYFSQVAGSALALASAR